MIADGSWIDLREHWVAVEEARMSMSRWKMSHQKGVELMASVYVVVITWRVWSCRWRKFEWVRCLRWRHHADQKLGG
jgi:hypothetical protein